MPPHLIASVEFLFLSFVSIILGLGITWTRGVGTYVAGLFFSFAQGLEVGYTCSLLEAVLAIGTYFTLL
jgi:hypothetical protein